MSSGNYRCKDCDESVDPKGSPHECDGSREDILATLDAVREENARLRAVADAARRIVAGVEACAELSLNGPDYDALEAALRATVVVE